MYNLIKKIEECGIVGFNESNLIIQKREVLEKKKFGLWKCQIYNDNFSLVWESSVSQNVGGIQIVDNFLMYIIEFKKTIFRKFSDLYSDYYSIDFAFTARTYPNQKNFVLGYFEDNRFFVLDLNNRKIQPYPIDKFFVQIVSNQYLIGTQNNASKLIIADHKFNTVWQRDISVEGQHKHWMTWEKSKKDEIVPGRILSTILYQEKYVIISMESSDSICLELATGKEVWRSGGGIWLSCVVGNIAYCTTNRSIWKLNLETGVEYKYQWEHSAPPDFEYKEFPDHQFTPYIHGMEYHEGLLWLLSYSSGASFIIAMHPETGNFEWIHRINTADKVMSMKFHNNRIYFNSTKDLFVYERE